jgi:FtsZ-interacting cell division protein ZipA
MAGLRWILLLAGLVFLAALAAWELRRPRQARGAGGPRELPRVEPVLFSDPGTAGVGPGRSADAGAGVLGPPPRIDLPSMEALREESIIAESDAVHLYGPPPAESHDAATAPEAAAAEAPRPAAVEAAPAAADPASAAVPACGTVPQQARSAAGSSLLVQWPPEGEREVLALRIVSASPERLSGRSVRQAITACGFVHGRLGIFHQPDATGRALLSVASLNRPGILDPVHMDFQRLSGISLFTVLPGPLPPAAALDHLLETARELARRLPARLQDETGEPLDAGRLQQLRHRVAGLMPPGSQAEPVA